MNLLNHELIYGNLYEKISNHLSDFLVTKNIANVRQKWKITVRGLKNFNREKYLNDLKKLENQSMIGTNANEVFDKY